ncbi:MAG: hypothetical protein ACE5H1_01200 [Thermodesulfobacteriota bacterium]
MQESGDGLVRIKWNIYKEIDLGFLSDNHSLGWIEIFEETWREYCEVRKKFLKLHKKLVKKIPLTERRKHGMADY